MYNFSTIITILKYILDTIYTVGQGSNECSKSDVRIKSGSQTVEKDTVNEDVSYNVPQLKTNDSKQTQSRQRREGQNNRGNFTTGKNKREVFTVTVGQSRVVRSREGGKSRQRGAECHGRDEEADEVVKKDGINKNPQKVKSVSSDKEIVRSKQQRKIQSDGIEGDWRGRETKRGQKKDHRREEKEKGGNTRSGTVLVGREGNKVVNLDIAPNTDESIPLVQNKDASVPQQNTDSINDQSHSSKPRNRRRKRTDIHTQKEGVDNSTVEHMTHDTEIVECSHKHRLGQNEKLKTFQEKRSFDRNWRERSREEEDGRKTEVQTVMKKITSAVEENASGEKVGKEGEIRKNKRSGRPGNRKMKSQWLLLLLTHPCIYTYMHAYIFLSTPGTQVSPTLQSSVLTQHLSDGSYSCMVCCDCIHSRDSIWSCRECYQVFHLKCIRKWATAPASLLNESKSVTTHFK